MFFQQRRRTVLVSKLPSNATEISVIQHFHKTSNGGDEIEDVKITKKGEALVFFKNLEGLT